MENNKKLVMYISAFGTILFWGSAFPATRYIGDSYSATSLMLLRFLVASITLLLFNLIKKSSLPKKEDLPLIFISGFIGIFLYMYCFNIACVQVLSGVSSFIIASAPIFTLIFSVIFLKEKPTKNGIIGLSISFLGLLVISISEIISSSFNIYIVLLVVCAILTSFYNILQRKILPKYTALEAVTYTVFSATLCMLIFTPKFITEFKTSTLNVNLVVVYLGVFPAALSYYLWNLALSLADRTSQVTVFLYFVPFVSIIMAYFWLGETISLFAFFGGILILLGMYVVNKKPKTKITES